MGKHYSLPVNIALFVFFFMLTGVFSTLPKLTQDTYIPVAQESEREACRRLGYAQPHWINDGFTCADKKGELHLVLPPDCNMMTHRNTRTNPCEYRGTVTGKK